MNALEVKRTLSGISPQSDVAKAIEAVLNGLRLAAVDQLSAAPTDANIKAREYHCGGLAYLSDARTAFRDAFAVTVAPNPPDPLAG